ncbi:protein TALPID3-like isoform X2 [Mercenaria mercenaria]|uniref:protein TALPID3-like isoform X2 n=1 Tax=Mercenaria mercenaria TaxID=6596 RepID=UPI00234EBD60|nr:protein TALPID3-like isoform X2 [Mercenaria mercenaria]
MASEESRPHSGNTSMDSKSSGGGQKSMLELLTITDAAVKALNKSSHSASSQGSKKSHHSDQLGQSIHSDRSERSTRSGQIGTDRSENSAHGQLNSDRSVRSAHSGHLQSDQSGTIGHLDSDRSVKSAQSRHSAESGHSVRSHQSKQSIRSDRSQHSGRSVGDSKVSQQVQDTSHDSGVISKTQTVSEDKSRGKTLTSPTDGSLHEQISDVSTTASDVLIRSTLDKSEHSILADGQNGNNGSSSGSSKCSKTSFGVENFNTAGPHKVKISRKHLREIKPPFEEGSPRSSASSDGKVPSALLGVNGKQSTRTGVSHNIVTKGRLTQGKDTEKEVVTSSNDSNGDKFPVERGFPRDIDSKDQFKVEKVRKSAEKAYEDVNMVTKTKPRTNGHILKDDKFDKKSQSSTGSSKSADIATGNAANRNNSAKDRQTSESTMQFISTPKYYVERHTPQKSQTRIEEPGKNAVIPERKNLLQELEESVEIITAHARDTSGSSSQPEIVTVREKIVTVSAKNSLSPASSVSDIVTKTAPPIESYHSTGYKLRDDRGPLADERGKTLDDSNMIPPALSRQQDDDDNLKTSESRPVPARFQWFSRSSGHGLQQGAPVSGHEAPDKPKDEDVHISDFKLTDKQKMAKETFARRQGGPIRRVVQPRIVGHDSKASSTSSTGEQKSQQPQLGQANDQVLTAAAAASAAVAATQPFLKAQQEMELKMAEVLARINELQSGPTQKASMSESDQERVRQLEKQIADMTDKRIDYMERLQEQQMAMQAKLLSMTRETTARPYHPRSYSPESHSTTAAVSNKAFSKTTVTRQPNVGDYTKHSALDLEESASPLDTPAPRARAPRPTIYDTSDIEYRVGRARSPKARLPKARSPQPRSRSPVKEKLDRGILHQILASADSPARDTYGRCRPPAEQTRVTEVCESPNVRKAKGLIEDLSHIKEQVKGLVEDKENWKSAAKDSSIQVQTETSKPDISQTSHSGPSPLDSYLHLPEQNAISPYKSVPDLSFSKINAPVLPGFRDAESILRQVQQNRGYLESNFEAVLRARQEVEVYSMLEAVYNDSTDQEKVRIQKMVDKSIQRLRKEVEREVTDDMVISEMKKKGASSVPGAVKIPEPAPAPKQSSKFGIRGRLQQPKMEPKVEPKKTVGKRPGMGGKENVHKFYRPPPKRKSVFEDEEAMTRIYGKASYQKGRTTVKDPYLHFQNTAKQKPSRQTVQPDVKGTEMMSSKTQTSGGGVRQFYFNPSTGTYIPIASTAAAAPIPGQLIPMAVPLGGPRMDIGLTVPSSMTSTPGPMTFNPISQVTAEGNVSMVSVGMEEEDRKSRPELGKQVLPAVDIDTDISEISEIMEEEPVQQLRARTPEPKPKKHVQIVSPRGTPNKTPGRSPAKAHYEVVYHEDPDSVDHEDREKVEEEESITISHPAITNSVNNHENHNSDDTIVDEDADVESAIGLELPGYQPEEVPEEQHNGPAFPPKLPSADRQLTSDLIAEDIRRRDILQNKATEWIEQELMARIITEVYSLKDTEEPHDLSHVVSETSEDSMAEEKEKSMFVMDTIGHRGMQLFIDAGYPVDNSLVNRLVEEVLQEKVRTMLGQRPDSEDQTQVRGQPRVPEDGPEWEEPVSEEMEEPSVHQANVSTPEPTPRASPRSSPPRRVSPAPTPVASPPAGTPRMVQEVLEPLEPPPPVVQQPVIQYIEPESEPESSASYDIKDELDRLAEKLQPDVNVGASIQSRHDIAAPPESPKPEPEPLLPARPLTPPELSPRSVHEEPFLVSQMAVPAGASMDQTHSRISKTKTESPKSATSPQVTEMAEEELAEDQPKPVVFTVAETQTDKVEEQKPRTRSPSPAKTRSRTPSESSYTESSSISDTFNECVSEGQWLINKSDGEVADFPIDEVAVRERMIRMSQKRVDVSSASTWKDIDDVDLEETDLSRSEGEFLYKTEFPPEKDPVLDMLARLQSAAPQYGMYQMSHKQVTDVLSTTGKSEGEVIRVVPAGQQQYIPERDMRHAAPTRSKSPRTRSPEDGASYQRGVSSPQKDRSSKKRSQSPGFRTQSPTRVSFEGDLNDQQRSVSPTRGILKRSSSFDNNAQGQPMRREDTDVPVRDSGRSHTPTGRLTPGGRQPQAKGMIGAGGRTAQQGKSSMRRPPQVIKSSTMPETRGSGSRLVNVRTSSEDYRDSFDNTGGQGYYGSDYGARNMTPDQMNVDALIQSGYLSQSFSQSENGVRTGQSSLKSSGDLRLSRTSASGRSFGYSYGTDGSISMSELQRLATDGTGKLQMSLTIPGTDQEESELSEIDITDGGSRR